MNYTDVVPVDFAELRLNDEGMTGAQRLAEAIQARLHELGFSLADWKRASGVSDLTLRRMRDGTQESFQLPKERAAEKALGWAPGSMQSIRQGANAMDVNVTGPRPAISVGMDSTPAADGPRGFTDEQRAEIAAIVAAAVRQVLQEEGR